VRHPTKRRLKINAIPHVRWAAYSAAATASTLIAARPAEATIHYSGLINEKFRHYDTDSFPLDPAGGVLVFVHHKAVYGSSSFYDGGTGRAFVRAAVSASMNGYEISCTHATTASGTVSNLKRRAVISQHPFFASGGVLANKGEPWFGCGEVERGQFLTAQKNAFIGFKFNNGNGTQFGWARLDVTGKPFNRFKLVDYAYGDPGERIIAGQMHSTNSGPGLESLAGLALGATALVNWRRRRHKTQSLI